MKTTFAVLWSAVVLCLGLTACGGGGGNSGGNGIAAPMGVDASGLALSDSPALQARGDEGAPSLTAQAATSAALDAQAITARLNGADTRNGLYYVYAANGTNGTRQKLRINFDTKSYTLTDEQGQATSGVFSEDPGEAGTYLFANGRITGAVNTARFRITPDAIVGMFPFVKPWSNPVSYEVTPFVAARTFVTDAAQLDGNYNRLGISRNSNGSSDSQILAMRISGKGTLLEMCFDLAIYRMNKCPYQSKRSYLLTASADSVWTGTNIATPSDVLQFRMARIGGENVWLSGGYTDAAPDVHVFRVGLKDSTLWPTARYVGGSSDARWGANVIGTTQASRTSFNATGASSTLAQPVSALGESAPLSLRAVNANGAQRYFAIQNGALSVVVGARSADTQGYIQVGLFKDHAGVDTRNGTYKVFSGLRMILDLTLDFDAGTYQMGEAYGEASSGTFSADPTDPGSYIFATSRISGAVNTARFRVVQDAVVGSFPFYVVVLPPNQYPVQPFIAARNFVIQRSELEGSYDLMVAGTPAGANKLLPLNLTRMVIPEDDSMARLCQLVPVTTCADGTSPFSVLTGVTPESWLLSGFPWTTLLYVAKVGNRRLALNAELQMYDNQTRVGGHMMMGLRRPSTGTANWASLRAHSYSGGGESGTTVVDATRYTTMYTRPNGTTAPFSLALAPVANNAQVKTGTDMNGMPYVVIQDDLFMFAMPTNGDASQLHISLAN